MIAAVSKLGKALAPGRITGPILTKELRVSSRRRRNYLLRFVYVGLLCGFVAIVWVGAVDRSRLEDATGRLQFPLMAAAARTIVDKVIWFVFISMQLVAVVMLSTSIRDEVDHRTLGLLMTTPISSIQIVTGKLLSKLLQIMLLLGITLPVLAILRVFGGVPWLFVVAGLSITLTAVLFAGVLSLYFSISSRAAYVVILKTLFVLASAYFFVPWVIEALGGSPPLLLNPFVTLEVLSRQMISGSGQVATCSSVLLPLLPIRAGGILGWWWHCAIMLVATVLLWLRSVQVVRRVALAQAAGALERETGRLGKWAARRKERLSRRAVKAVDGSPIMWKELCSPTIEGPDDTNSIIGLVATLAALLFTYAMAGYQNCLHYDLMQMAYVVLFLFLGAAVTVVLSASAVTSEKERRCWPILLGTPIGDWEILWQKAAAVFRRCLPIWALLAGHVLLFVVMRYIHPMAIPQVLLIASWVVVFLEGLGLYFSSRLSRTTSSVVASIGFAVTLWVVLPIMLFLSAPLTHGSGPALTATSMNPIVQATVVMTGSGGEANAMKAPGQLLYNWPTGRAGLGECMRILVVSWAAYAAAGLFLAWRAKRGFRRHIF